MAEVSLMWKVSLMSTILSFRTGLWHGISNKQMVTIPSVMTTQNDHPETSSIRSPCLIAVGKRSGVVRWSCLRQVAKFLRNEAKALLLYGFHKEKKSCLLQVLHTQKWTSSRVFLHTHTHTPITSTHTYIHIYAYINLCLDLSIYSPYMKAVVYTHTSGYITGNDKLFPNLYTILLADEPTTSWQTTTITTTTFVFLDHYWRTLSINFSCPEIFRESFTFLENLWKTFLNLVKGLLHLFRGTPNEKSV